MEGVQWGARIGCRLIDRTVPCVKGEGIRGCWLSQGKGGVPLKPVMKRLNNNWLHFALFTACLNPTAWNISVTEGYRLSKPTSAKVTDRHIYYSLTLRFSLHLKANARTL